jgi:hypothetical protein
MTMTLVWTGVAFWLGLNAALAARYVYIALPELMSSAKVIQSPRRQG